MAATSPTASVKSREIIGGDQFSRRREVFEKHDTVFLPLPSPTSLTPTYKEVEPIITTNHGITTSNFKRNTVGYSSMRETRSEDRNHDFRPRKYSDNFTSELNQSEDVDYRYNMAERNRRLSKLRRDFLKSNIHEPGDNTFSRSGVRASLPTTSTVSSIRYKIENLNIHKFPFAEPYSTPTPTRRVIVDLGNPDEDDSKENGTSPDRTKYTSMPNNGLESPTIDRQKVYDELIKRYSPQQKPINWTLPPTRPKVVGSVAKSTSSAADSIDTTDKKDSDANNAESDDVFESKDKNKSETKEIKDNNDNIAQTPVDEVKPNVEILHNGPELSETENETDQVEHNKIKNNDSKITLSDSEEIDYVPELLTIKRQISSSRDTAIKTSNDKFVDLTIPKLLEKMNTDGEEIDNHKSGGKKLKRKRSFLDKLLGRNKGVKSEK